MSRLGHIIQIKLNEDITSEQSVRRSSPLLYAVCCLNGLRFCDQPDLINTSDHRQLYEEVRDMLGQVVLASPLPIEELYALLIMSTFEAAPRACLHVLSFDAPANPRPACLRIYRKLAVKWHLCTASHLIHQLCPDTRQFDHGKTSEQGQAIFVLVEQHLSRQSQVLFSPWEVERMSDCCRFAVGTGKPTTIPWEYIQHCPSILNHPQASIEDGIILAEILLLSVLCEKPRSSLLLDRDGQSRDLAAWEQRWAHLLSK